MKKLTLLVAGVFALNMALMAVSAEAAAVKCSKCKMAMVAKKDKAHPVAVKVKGKTYYCCAGCGAHKAVAKGKKPVKMSALPKCPMCKTHTVSLKKDASHPHAVKINGKTYYSCCG